MARRKASDNWCAPPASDGTSFEPPGDFWGTKGGAFERLRLVCGAFVRLRLGCAAFARLPPGCEAW